MPVLLRMTTRVCHSQDRRAAARHRRAAASRRTSSATSAGRVMIPAYARPAHRRLRAEAGRDRGLERDLRRSTASIDGRPQRWASSPPASPSCTPARPRPEASVLKLGMTYPLPAGDRSAHFAAERRALRRRSRRATRTWSTPSAPPASRSRRKPEMYRFGELNVARVRRILAGDTSPEAAPPPRQAAAALPGLPAPHRLRGAAQARLHRGRRHRLLHAGRAAAVRGHGHAACAWAPRIGVGLGLRHVLPPDAGPPRGQRHRRQHLRPQRHHRPGRDGLQPAADRPRACIILDNGTTAMTGQQEHPGTGRTLDHEPTGKLVFEDLARAARHRAACT